MKNYKLQVTNYKLRNKGFTLIELLIVIAIIATLIVVVFVALNPLRLFAESRNAQRWEKVSEFLHAVQLYTVQRGGRVPNGDIWREDIAYVLGTDKTGCDLSCGAMITASECLPLTDLGIDKKVSELPRDPQTGTPGNTDIYVYRQSGSVVTVGACDPELGEVIQLTR